jgi:hypothetical protein
MSGVLVVRSLTYCHVSYSALSPIMTLAHILFYRGPEYPLDKSRMWTKERCLANEAHVPHSHVHQASSPVLGGPHPPRPYAPRSHMHTGPLVISTTPIL